MKKRIRSLIYPLATFLIFLTLTNSCKKETPKVIPTIKILAVTNITSNSAKSGGEVTADGGAPVTARGMCWSLNQNPTTADTKTNNGSGIGSFTSSITGLTPGATYYIKAYAINSIGTAYSSQSTFTTLALAPVLTTTDLTAVTSTTANSGGNISNDGGSPVTARGVCWSTTQNPTIADSKTTDGTGTGEFTSNITGLTANTTYYVRAYATNSAGTGYGTQNSFQTASVPVVAPTVSTTTPSEITQISATSGGNVTSDGNATVTARGVCWSTSQTPTTSHNKTTDGTGTGEFTSNLTGLTANTTYYVRAYATNSAGTGYGTQNSFQTASVPVVAPTVSTTTPSEITQISATSGGNVTSDGNATVTARGICWSTSENPTISDNKTSNGTGAGTFYSIISGLTANTTYYVRAYATNSAGTGYGTQNSFQTESAPVVAPTVRTKFPSNIFQISATSGGNVTSDGNAAVTARGICWSTSETPTISDNKTSNGTGTGEFTSNLTGLTGITTYYVRAYATNSAGTGYGEQNKFTTNNAIPPTGYYTDSRDSQEYAYIVIGNQTWFADNLNYQNTNSSTYNNDPANGDIYGRLYTWEAALTACPSGWHLPSDNEWTQLTDYLKNNGYGYYGGTSIGSSMAAISGWNRSYGGGNQIGDDHAKNNSSGFNGLPGGYRTSTGSFYELGRLGQWWSSSEGSNSNAWTRFLWYYSSDVSRKDSYKEIGFSVRCLKDNSGNEEENIPLANFTTNATSGPTPLTVNFTDQSTNNPTGWLWDFGDGNTSTSQNPSHIYSATGTYTVSLTVTNTYGSDTETKSNYINITNKEVGTITDYDGNTYNTIKIGNQWWMAENLRTTHNADGTAIASITDNDTWSSLDSGAYSWYNNDSTTYSNPYGTLYNWYAAANTKLCPSGWHVPSYDEWETLINYLGGESTAGGKLKESGITHWLSPNTGATNESGFTALPGGSRGNNDGQFGQITYSGCWWSTTAETNTPSAWGWSMHKEISTTSKLNYANRMGHSVRCIKD